MLTLHLTFAYCDIPSVYQPFLNRPVCYNEVHSSQNIKDSDLLYNPILVHLNQIQIFIFIVIK